MKSKANQSYWTCTRRGCRAKATMNSDGWFHLSKYKHNHDPNYDEMEKKEIISELRKLSVTTTMTIPELLAQVGIKDDNDRKYRDTINFWRWRAKRKSEAETVGVAGTEIQWDEDAKYKFIKTGSSHYLQFRKYLYRKYMSSKIDSGSYWRCRLFSCPARAKITAEGDLMNTNFNHNHSTEEVEGEDTGEDVNRLAKEAALHTDLPIPEILKMYQAEEDNDLKKYLKNIRGRKQRNLREQKRKMYDDESTSMVLEGMDDIFKDMPAGTRVKIPSSIITDFPETSDTDAMISYVEGTVVKIGDQVSVKLLSNPPSPASHTVDDETYLNDTDVDEFEQVDDPDLKFDDLSECVFVVSDGKTKAKETSSDAFEEQDPYIYEILTEK